jgi:hypothetical protein
MGILDASSDGSDPASLESGGEWSEPDGAFIEGIDMTFMIAKARATRQYRTTPSM